VCRLKILFGGEALFFSMDGRSSFFDDFCMRMAVARSGGMEHWIEGGSIRDKRAVQTKIREVYHLMPSTSREICLNRKGLSERATKINNFQRPSNASSASLIARILFLWKRRKNRRNKASDSHS